MAWGRDGATARLLTVRTKEPQMQTHSISLSLVSALLLSGCAGGTSGELGVGQFFYECGESDFVCFEVQGLGSWLPIDLASDQNEPFPEFVAVGAEFDVTFNVTERLFADDDEERTSVAEPASPEMLMASDSHFTALTAGVTSIVARAESGNTFDFLYVELVPIMDIEVRVREPEVGIVEHSVETTLMLDAGARVTVDLAPVGARGQALGGGVQWAATVDDPDVATVDVTSAFETDGGLTFTLVAQGEGQATLTLEMEDYSETIELTVGAQGEGE